MNEEVNNKNKIGDKTTQKKYSSLLLLIFLVCGGFISTFIGGYLLHTFINQNNNQPVPTVAPTPVPDDQIIDPTTVQNGKKFYEDTIMSISLDTPKKILVATVSRQETDSGINQNTRVSYFDGTTWQRKTVYDKVDTLLIHPNSLISSWVNQIDPTRVLKETINGKILFDTKTLVFDTDTISNNISMRSLPGYTKFMSNSNGTLNIDGKSLTAKSLYTRIYSNDLSQIQFYNTPIGLNTYWLAFWDSNGNFYHVDTTTVDNPTNIYQTHQIAVEVDALQRVTKTFDVKITPDNEIPPRTYRVNLGSPINKTLIFNTDQSLNKAPGGSYKWFMSNGTGSVNNIEGFGITEYIKS